MNADGRWSWTGEGANEKEWLEDELDGVGESDVEEREETDGELSNEVTGSGGGGGMDVGR